MAVRAYTMAVFLLLLTIFNNYEIIHWVYNFEHSKQRSKF